MTQVSTTKLSPELISSENPEPISVEPTPVLDSELKKSPLDEALAFGEPSVTLSAGSLRATLKDDGLVLNRIEESVDETPVDTTENTMTDDSFMMKPVSLPELRIPEWVKQVQMGAMVFSGVWIAISLIALLVNMGTGLFALPPHELGGVIAGVLAPVALLWLGLSHLTRTYDAQRYGEALRAELHALIFPSEDRQQRISHDIEKLCQQAAELSNSSRTVLKAIQKSRQALQQEARDFVILSRKAEVHIDKLAENLHDRVAKLHGVTEEIERKTGAIDARTRDGAKAWDDTAAHILVKADEIEAALGRGADKILGAADIAKAKAGEIEGQLNTTFDHLSTSIDDVAERLTSLSSEFDTHGANLSRSTEKVVDETTRLGHIIETQVSELESMTTGVFEAVAKSSEMVKVQRESLDAGARDLVRQADDVVVKLKSSGDQLDFQSRDVQARLGDVETRVSRQVETLRDALESLESQTRTVEQTGDGLAVRLSESLSVALSGSESLSAAVRRAVEAMENASREARTQADGIVQSMGDRIDGLQQASSAQVVRVDNLNRTLEQHRDQLLEAARRAEEQTLSVMNVYDEKTMQVGLAVTALTEKLHDAGKGIDAPIKAIETAVQEADRRHEQIEQTLVRRVEDLARASDKAREAADHIQATLRTQAQEMSILSGQIGGQVRSIGEQIAQQKDMLGSHASRAVQDLEQVRGALSRQAETLQNVATDMNSDLVKLTDRMSEKTSILRLDTENVTMRLSELDDKITSSVGQIGEQVSRLTDATETATASLDATLEHAEPIYRRAIDQASTAQDRFEILGRTFDATATTNLERLQQIGNIFDDRLSQLRTGVQEAAQILRTSGDELRQRVDDIENASLSANDRMNNVSKTLNNQITDIHLLTDQALIKVENVQKAIESQFHELNASVGRAVSELMSAEHQFGDVTSALDTSAENSLRKIQGITREAMQESSTLQNAAASVVKTTQDLLANLQSESKSLLVSAGDSLMEIKKIGDGFSMRAHELEEHMKSSLNMSQNYGRDLKEQAGLIGENAIDTADKIARAVTTMNTKIGEVERAANTVGDKIEQVRTRLEGDANKFMATAKQAVDAAEEASSSYARQSNVLFKAAQEAVAQIDKIKDVQGRRERDAFLSSAKFVIESLHSLSVDFVRVLEGDVEAKTWKAFQKGDVAAFTRRLVQNLDALPADRIRAKFAGDSEFRSYVQRFIRGFEDMFDQAVANDHGELLAATFLSSDIGRLYAALCTATGREAKMGRDIVTKAA